MLCTTPPQSVSKNITCSSMRIRGAGSLTFPQSFRKRFEINGKRNCSGGCASHRSFGSGGWHNRLYICGASAPCLQERHYRLSYFFDRHGFHTSKIDWALAQKTGAALHLMAQDNVTVSERSGQPRFGGSEDGDG